jgi:uncharacterized sporulation protein YeaH/YhbH (DUF444 family)
MPKDTSEFVDQKHGEGRWYDLFSRGARDWLRHNDKVREAVREQLPDLISNAELIDPTSAGTVQVPVKFLEHFRFKLSDQGESKGVGQGEGKPGDTLVGPQQDQGKGTGGGNDEGGYEFVLELKIDDIVDWLWEELKLPNLKMKAGALSDADYVREGWNRRGVRSRLDRRRSVKEALKRRAVQRDGPAFTDDDLRFKQLVVRKQPSTDAVIYFAMDVSSSMTETDRQLAKSFFFWAAQGLRRQYLHIEPVFIAHTTTAWEFSESEFFQVSGSGGTVASTAFAKILEVSEGRFDPAQYNTYVFYASDGENFSHDRENARSLLMELGAIANYIGYVEVASARQRAVTSEMSGLFADLESQICSGRFVLTSATSVWDAIRAFFSEQADVEQAP